MAPCLYFAVLEAGHARQVAALERSVHRQENVHGFRELREELASAERKGNLSLGLWDRAKLVGYVLAYVELHGCEDGSDAPTVYISDLAVLPGYRRMLRELIGRWGDLVRASNPDLPVEAHSFRPEFEKWHSALAPLFADAGFRISSYRQVDEEGELARFWIRWHHCSPPRQDPRAIGVIASYVVGGRTYDVRVVQDALQWSRLEPFWNTLLHETPESTGFQSYEYMRAWWRCFGLPRRRLLILTFWHGGELRGIAPLALLAIRTLSGWVRELSFLGTRLEVDRPTFLFGNHVQECTEALIRCLDESDAPWDRLHLHEQTAEGPYVPALCAYAESRQQHAVVQDDAVSPFLPLETSFEAFLASRSRHFRKRVRSAVRKLESCGKLRFDRCSDWPRVTDALRSYRNLEARSWKNGHEAGIGETRRAAFYDQLLRTLGPKGAFHVLSLTLDDQLIASTIAMVHGTNYYSLQITHDSDYSKFSPGTVLEYFELQDCFGSDYTEYDFLGGHLVNKRRWTSDARHSVRVVITKRSAWSPLEHFWLLQLRPRVRTLLARSGLLSRAVVFHGRIKEQIARLLNGTASRQLH